MPRSIPVVTTTLFLLVALSSVPACGSDSTTAPPGEPNTVGVGNDFFNPANLEVDPGTTVTWTWGNTGGVQHNVTWVGVELPNSPSQASGTHQVTMPSEAGEYDYYCTLHGTPTSGMRGTVVVE